jgi:hypothetical protein
MQVKSEMIPEVVLRGLVVGSHLIEAHFCNTSFTGNLQQAHGLPCPHSGYASRAATVIGDAHKLNTEALSRYRCRLPGA